MTSTLPPRLAPIVGDTTVPLDGTGGLVDSGQWRERGVTHWHLIEPREWKIVDTARFDTERMRVERVRSSAGVAKSPAEVVTWLAETREKLIVEYELGDDVLRQSGIATEEQRRLKRENAFWMASKGLDVCSMQALRGGRISHFSAYAMTVRDCSAPH